MPSEPPRPDPARLHRTTAFAALSAVVLMLGLSFASVPLYRAFCRATGYGGTTHVAAAGPAREGSRTLTIRFDANVAPGLPWSFEPETPEIALKTGTTATVYYRVHNLSARPTAANALYNVTPEVGGFYFNKISCFCFSEQHLGPDEVAELPVVFFLDPALDKDPTLRAVDSLTLSYTFFAAKRAAPDLAASGQSDRAAPGPRL
jgi:cytochrome c oxidase assembly protein subunit 11